MEAALDDANRGRAEAERNAKTLLAQLAELQAALETERGAREEAQDLVGTAERRFAACVVELDDARTQLETGEKARKTAEVREQVAIDKMTEVSAAVASLTATRKKLENDVLVLQVSLFSELLVSEGKQNLNLYMLNLT